MRKNKNKMEWGVVYKRWKSHSVPEVEIISFDISTHNNRTAWLAKEDGSQFHMGNPTEDTARHLLKSLNNWPDDVRAAFKIHAYAKSARAEESVRSIVRGVYQIMGEDFYWWWHPNAVNTLPDIRRHYYIYEDKPSVEEVVDKAAQTWAAIADEWVLVRTPDYLDWSDPVYKVYQERMSTKYEQREYREYLRLKKKFEPGS